MTIGDNHRVGLSSDAVLVTGGGGVPIAAIPTNLGQPHKYGFHPVLFLQVHDKLSKHSPVKRPCKWHRLSHNELGVIGVGIVGGFNPPQFMSTDTHF